MTDDERAIRDLIDTWMSATAAGDTPTVLSLMTDDVVFMVAGHEPFGKEAFSAASEGQQAFKIEGRSDIRELEVMDDWAWARTHLRVTMTPREGGEPVVRSGYTLTILRREPDGRWRLARDANLLTREGGPS